MKVGVFACMKKRGKGNGKYFVVIMKMGAHTVQYGGTRTGYSTVNSE